MIMWKIDYERIDNYKSEYLSFLFSESSNKKNKLHKLQTEWEELRKLIIEKSDSPNKTTKHPELYNEKLEDFLVMDFPKLFKVYLDFITLIPDDDYYKIVHKQGTNGKKITKDNPAIENTLFKKAEEIFNYKQYSDKIADFFKYYAKPLKITSCFYCDSAYINLISSTYNSNKESTKEEISTYKRMFDVDHFIPKAQCPILALCLHNFVPSCKICNSTVKGDAIFQEFYQIDSVTDDNKKLEIIRKLAPSSSDYEYDKNVKLSVLPQKKQSENWYPPSNFYNNPDFFRISFIHKDNDYQKATKAFMLEERYNFGEHLAEALNLLDLQKRYTKSNIKYIKDILCQNGSNITEEQIEEDLFHKNMNSKTGRIFSKLKTDILN